MFKKFITALAVIVTMSGSVQAADAPAAGKLPEAKIVVVDIPRIMKDSAAAKDLKAQLESKRNQYQADIKAKSDKLKKQKDDLDKQQGVLSKDALTAKQKQFLADYKALQDDANEKSIKFENAEKTATRDIVTAVRSIIETMATEQGFNIAIPTTQLFFAHRDFDITDEILKRLDKKMPNVTLKFDSK